MKTKFGRRRTKSIFLAFVLLGLFVFKYAEAEEGYKTIEVEPAKIRLIISPGNSQAGTIKIYNSASEPKQVKVYLEDWVYMPGGDGTKDFKPAGTTQLSGTNWISFVPSEFTIPAFGKQVVNYTVKVPQDAKGGHYAVLFFESYLGEQKITQGGVNVNLAVRVASLFYIEPKGTIDRQVKIENLKITKDDDRFNIAANLTNIGNVDISCKSDFFIIDSKGMVYARGDFNQVYTFPGETATLTSSWREKIPAGKYDLILTLDIGTALKEAGLGEVPAITKEAQIEIGSNAEIAGIGELK